MNKLHDLIFVFAVLIIEPKSLWSVWRETEREKGFPVRKAWRHSKKTHKAITCFWHLLVGATLLPTAMHDPFRFLFLCQLPTPPPPSPPLSLSLNFTTFPCRGMFRFTVFPLPYLWPHMLLLSSLIAASFCTRQTYTSLHMLSLSLLLSTLTALRYSAKSNSVPPTSLTFSSYCTFYLYQLITSFMPFF